MISTLKGESSEISLKNFRAQYSKALRAQPVAEGVEINRIDMGGVSGLRIVPAAVANGRNVLFSHGGGYISTDAEDYKGFASTIAARTNTTVYIPDYRLAPEHPFPIPIRDVVTSYRWLLDQGIEANEIAFAGDSAGGALVVSVMTIARDEGLPVPAAGVAMSPWVNLEHTGKSLETREARDLIHMGAPGGFTAMADLFLADAPASSPKASPVYANLSGLPPFLIQVGEAEKLMSDSLQLTERLAESGVRVTLEVWPNMFHVWQMQYARLPEAAEAIGNMRVFLDRVFDRVL